MTDALRHLRRVDPVMAQLIRRAGPFTPTAERRRGPYEALVRAVAHQQLTGKAAQTILDRFVMLYGGDTYPSPEQLIATPDHYLRGVGFSRAKTVALKDIAAKTQDGTIPERQRLARMKDETIIERLTEARGVGRWTVEMFLMFTLGRPDVLPVDDYGIRNGFARAFRRRELPAPADVEKRGVRWKPYRTVASWYLWRALELPRGGAASATRRSEVS
jgi:3-methyladenine DNA glycosylase/8-oxoguanine DNA glycosylase